MDAALSEIASLPASSKTSAFTTLLDKTLASQSNTGSSSNDLARDLNRFISSVVQDSVGLVISKQIVALFVKRLHEITDLDARRTVAEKTLELLQDRQASFEDQVMHTPDQTSRFSENVIDGLCIVIHLLMIIDCGHA